MKICPKCHRKYSDEMNYCEVDGNPLNEYEQTSKKNDVNKRQNKIRLLDKGFIPTNYIDWKKPTALHYVYYIFIIIMIIHGSICILNIIDIYYHDIKLEIQSDTRIDGTKYKSFEAECTRKIFCDFYLFRAGGGEEYNSIDEPVNIEEENELKKEVQDNAESMLISISSNAAMFNIGIALLYGILAIFIKRIIPYPNNSTPHLSDIADYIEKYSIMGGFRYNKHNPKYIIYIKDRKWGILNATTFSITLEAKYNSLKWRKEKGFLDAELNGEEQIIDVNGKELII